ncbi:DUF2851 family protein [Parasediminibacterium sp. JCM 36343]|uniref:DUF2851 family protein n=1 Tax=Parasediminibacterium sp. JCM 36343 TaxID=3374279 RepID=UPI00397C4D20
MNEKLLQFIWQFQYFNRDALQVENGEALSIIKIGLFNKNQGPDFTNASIKIGEVQLVGNIEIHTLSSDWLKHKHTADKQYGNIILHVVWQNDVAIQDMHGNTIPVLVLENRVPKLLLSKYTALMDNGAIPCHGPAFPDLDELSWVAWKERLLAERLERKAEHVLELLKESNNHWEEVFWWMLAANFGVKVNTALFEAVAKTIPVNVLAKHKQQIHQLEALLLGQANLLEGEMEEDYPRMLQKEYAFLLKKYKLRTTTIQPNFLRMRPANFPTVRLAQLAMLVQESSHLFSKIKEMDKYADVLALFTVTANDYWHYHYRFNQITEYKPKALGTSTINNIVINTIVPVLFAYGMYVKEESYKEKAINWLTQVKAEENNLTKSWQGYGTKNKTAFDSQSLIELTNNYCHQKRCLDCAIGNKILRAR